MAISEKLIDKRVVTRNIKKGSITTDAYQQHLSELPDRADNIFKPEEVEQEEASNSQRDGASSEIQSREPAAEQTACSEARQPPVESRATSVEEQPAPLPGTQPDPVAPAPSFGASESSSDQPESQPDPYKPSSE